MNKLRIPALFILLAVLTIFRASAQEDSTALNTLLAKTQKFADQYPPEKVYLHFDKPYYAVGDTIWFKGYIVQGQNQPSLLSKIVYVDVYTSADSLVQTLKLPITNGAAYGSVLLDKASYKQGNYYIRAYTLWMANFSDSYFFYKNIVLGEAIDNQVKTNIRFSPAGDQKVNARISFKDPEGKPYASKQVNWQLITSYDVVNKGRATTDADGVANIVIPLDSKKAVIESSSKLVTTFSVADNDPPVSTAFSLRDIKLTNDLQFFPEGGEFIIGIPLQVAFKGIKSNGLGIDLKGVLKDNMGNKLIEFNSRHLGMGSFYINPETGKTYTVEVTFADGSSAVFKLPAAKPSGISLQVNNKSAEAVDVKAIASNTYLEENKGKTFFLMAQHNGAVYFAGKATLKSQLFSVKIPKNKLPDGLLQITLFSQANDPLSERMVFIKNKSMLNLTIKADKPSYGIKQKVKLTIETRDTLKAVPAGLSLAVIDETKVPFDDNDETTILSSLLLTSDLQGFIEKPNYYFVKTDEKKLADLDILMLTQGFRRFTYKEILADKYPKATFQPEQSINISGTLRNKTGLPINKGALLMTIPEKKYNKQMLTNAVGEFTFRDLVFNDSNQVTINAKYNPSPSSLMVMVDGLPEAGPGKNKNIVENIQNIDSAISNYLVNSSKQYRNYRTIKEVAIAGTKVKRPSHSDHSNLNTLSMVPDHLIEGSQFETCGDMMECVKFRLTGVTYEDYNFYVTRDYNSGKKIPMAIFVDGISVDFPGLNIVQPKDIESIEIFYNDFIGTINTAYGTSGVIEVNTKKKPKGTKISKEDLKKLFPDPFIVSYFPKGYTKEREFYVPKYGVDPTALNFVDLRTTVYWNPRLTTDASGTTTIEFFNADGKGLYKAVLEGIDANGNIGRTVFRYTVK